MISKIQENIFYGSIPEAWIFIAVLLLTFMFRKYKDITKNLPPGPIGLPIVGYFPFLTKFPHFKFLELAEKYGDVFSLYVGSRLVVVLNDGDTIRKALSKKELLARPPEYPMTIFNGLHSPASTPNLKEWQEHNRFMLQTMRDLGLGKSRMEHVIQDEIQHFLNVLEQSKGQPIDVTKPLIPSISNNICSLIFGERYEYDNPQRILLDNAVEHVRTMLGPIFSSCYFPRILKYLTMLKLTKYTKSKEALGMLIKVTEEKISQHRETFDPKNVRDYIDGYILEMEKKKEKGLETTFTDASLMGSSVFLVNAGGETIKSTLTYCVHAMAAFPEVQKKVQREIQEVLGSSRFPEFPDYKNMPYTKAVIHEIMRWKTLVPLNPIRYALDDCYVDGYCIPKGSYVITNIWSVHHNPKYWENPEEFQPERFLNPDGTFTKSNYFMPFSVGKRACPGEQMANIEVFLYFVAIVQRFQISFPEGYKPNFEIDVAVTLRLKTFPICFIPN